MRGLHLGQKKEPPQRGKKMMLFYHFLFQPGDVPQGLVDGLALSLVPVLPDDLDLLLIKLAL